LGAGATDDLQFLIVGGFALKDKLYAGSTVGAALPGRPSSKTRIYFGRVATEGHPYSCALESITFEAKLYLWLISWWSLLEE
jgi:hypothetical protein